MKDSSAHSRLLETFVKFTGIDSPSFGERGFCDALKAALTELGITYEEDDAGAVLGGDSGNLYAYARGVLPGKPILLSAHMDTVEPSRGKTALVNGDKIASGGVSVLGADDVSGVTIILDTLARLKETNTPRRDVELLFTVAEEKYCLGSAVFDYSKIKSDTAYTLDLSGNIGEAANAAPTIFVFAAAFTGKAAHAGFAPESGIHAIQAAANALAKLPSGTPEDGLTFNIGTIRGGSARNIVPDGCEVSGEIRCLNHERVTRYWEWVKSVFVSEAKALGACVEFTSKTEITAYHTPETSGAADAFRRACEKTGITPRIHATLGGSDNNNFALHGINGLVIACSMHDVHSSREYTLLSELDQCVNLISAILTDCP
jgi:tripeptide aminopeptidase